MDISIIIPFYNEEDSLPILIDKLFNVLEKNKKDFEIILVDDGSTDNSNVKIQNAKTQFAKNSKQITMLSHRKRLGKGKALLTGFKAAKGDTILFMDADLQDDPNDIPLFLDKIESGNDLVNGWRIKRNDSYSKTIPSFIFNTLLLKWFFKSKFHDINCGFKAMKRDVLEEINLYGDNYRFIPIIAEQQGFKTTEVAVRHHSRKFGKSKYGFLRLFFGLMDTVTIYFVYKFSEKPLHFFGPIGLVSFMAGVGITIYLTIERIFFRMMLYRRPLLTYGVLFIIVGLQIIMTGIIAELVVYMQKVKQKK